MAVALPELIALAPEAEAALVAAGQALMVAGTTVLGWMGITQMASNIKEAGKDKPKEEPKAEQDCPKKEETPEDEGKQDKRLTKGEIKKLQDNDIDPHDLKPKTDGSKYDLFKDREGNIKVKPKNGSGPGDPTGFNINDF